MTDKETKGREQAESGGRVVYVIPNDITILDDEHRRFGIFESVNVLWGGKWIILSLMILSIIVSAAYVIIAPPWYRAETVLIASDDQSTQAMGSQLSGLAALAGVQISDTRSPEAIATLRSREFARSFIEDHDLLPVLFPDEWDEQKERWRNDDPSVRPSIHDGVKHFHENLLGVSEDSSNGLVTLSIEWTDADLAMQWANELVRRVNERLRVQALAEASDNLSFLRSEMAQAQILSLQQSIARLVEIELQNKMLAEGNVEYAFRTIDPATLPWKPVRPRPLVVFSLGIILAGLIAFTVIFVRYLREERRR